MRSINSSENFNKRERAELAAKGFFTALRTEISPIVYSWKPDKVSACILWLNEEETENDAIYGDTDGLYLVKGVPNVCLFLPRTTEAYEDFCQAMEDFYDENDEMYYETIPIFLDLWFNGNMTINLAFFSTVTKEEGEKAYASAKTIANELVLLLSGNKDVCEPTYFEKDPADEENKKGYTGSSEAYFVGIKLSFDINKNDFCFLN